MDKNTIEIIGVTGIPEVRHGDDIAELIVSSADNQKCLIRENDIFVIAQKIVSKAEGQIINLNHINYYYNF